MIRSLTASLILATSAAHAGAPKVVTDIAPVHSLVAQVMGDLGTPDLMIAPGVSPHHYSMRPSEAAALQDADVVVWIGEALTPQLGRSIEALGAEATVLSLMAAPNMHLLEYRELDEFDAADHGKDENHDDHAAHDGHDDHHGHEDEHGNDDHGHDDHGHDDNGHDDHAHDEHGHDGHANEEHADDDHGHKDEHGHDEHAGHDHHHEGALDPHLWLDPENAQVALTVIADLLSKKDPENSETYKKNARAAAEAIGELDAGLKTRLAPLHDRSYLVYHDAYQYFETRYGISASGAIAVGDAQSPGPARLQRVREILVESAAVCVFSEPQLSPKLTKVVTEGTDVRGAVIDPLGAEIAPGAGLYAALLDQMADSIEECLAPVS